MFCYFAVTNFVDFKTLCSLLKLPTLSGLEVQFAHEECYTFSAVFKTWKAFVYKEIW